MVDFDDLTLQSWQCDTSQGASFPNFFWSQKEAYTIMYTIREMDQPRSKKWWCHINGLLLQEFINIRIYKGFLYDMPSETHQA